MFNDLLLSAENISLKNKKNEIRINSNKKWFDSDLH